MNANSKRQSKPLPKNGEGKWCGRFWLLLESFSDVPQHSTASQEELGCRHFKCMSKTNANADILLFCRRSSPVVLLLLLLKGQSSMALPVSLHMALGDELQTWDKGEDPQPSLGFLGKSKKREREQTKLLSPSPVKWCGARGSCCLLVPSVLRLPGLNYG